MTRDQLERAKVLVSCIDTAERNIAKFEEIKSSKEIRIQDDANGTPIYIGGKNKDKIIDMLIDEQQIFMKRQQQELDKL